jgi:hypothetical protein
MQGHLGWRCASISLGVVAAALGCWGAYEFGCKLEGGASYLSIAAPVVALAAAVIPPLAENAWRRGQYAKSLFWWAVLIPAAATVFFGAAERVHLAKAGAQAERQALRNEAERARQDLIEAKIETAKAQAEARKTCGASCREAKLARDEANARLEKAEQALLITETKATTEASLKAPEWLLPAALDLIAFMAIWTGLTGPKAQPEPKARKQRKAKAKARVKPQPLRRPTDLLRLLTGIKILVIVKNSRRSRYLSLFARSSFRQKKQRGALNLPKMTNEDRRYDRRLGVPGSGYSRGRGHRQEETRGRWKGSWGEDDQA